MAIKDDIQSLITKEEALFEKEKRYVQALPTPETLTTKDSTTSFTKLSKPSDETVEIEFTPTAKDYQFQVDVWSRQDGDKTTQGFVVTARRDLGDGIIETVTSEGPDV